MFKRDWFKYAALSGVGLLLFGLLTGIPYLIYSNQHAKARESAAEHHKDASPKPLLIQCQTIGFVTVVCAAPPPEPEEIDEYTKEDLKTQQESAEWSFLSMIMSAFGVLIATAGTFYIARTLNATVVATNAARKSTEISAIQARPWVKVKITKPTRMETYGERGFCVIVDGEADNVGHTPALGFYLHYEVVRISDTKKLFQIVEDCKTKSGESSRAIFPNIPYKPTPSKNIKSGKWVSIPREFQDQWPIPDLGLLAVASYRAYGEDTIRQTPRLFKIVCNEDRFDFNRVNDCSIEAAHQKGLDPT